MKANKQVISLIVIGLMITGAIIWQRQATRPAPDASFTTITGKKISLTQFQGKPVIVTFWATDCPGCIKEIPHLIDLYKQFHTQGLEIIAVSMYYDIPSHVVAMAKAKQLPYDIALDLSAEHANAFGQVELTPSTFLISPTGTIIKETTGLFDISDMKQRIYKLLTNQIS